MDSQLRLYFFISVFVLMAVWESWAPHFSRHESQWRHWLRNLSISLLSQLGLRLILPLAAVGVAALAEEKGFGLFNELNWPQTLEVLISVLILDLLIYWQHRIFHQVPWLWRLHRVHHTDLDFDVSTGIRFHPLEIGLSMLIKIGAVYIFGISALAILIFEILLSSTSLFSHANISLPRRLDLLLRRLIVTPDMHRIHHSVRMDETNSNYGFSFSFWDRIFKSYRASAQGRLIIGVESYSRPEELGLARLLIQPFTEKSRSSEL